MPLPLTRRGFCAAAAGVRGSNAASRRPNILFLISDDQSSPHLGCYGDRFAATPAIDRLASEGARFTNAFVTAPQCSPSRSSFFSGCTPHAIGTSRQASFYPPRQPSVVETLRSLGYAAAAFGKVHQGAEFDRRFDSAEANPAAFAKFLDRASPAKPWFVQVGYRQPHRPYREDGAPAGLDPAKVPVPDWMPDTPKVRLDLCRYYEQIRGLDAAVAEALDALRRHSLEEDTLLIFMGDNGMPFARSKGTLYDAGIRVPLIVRWPGKAVAGFVSDALVSGLDIPATCMEASGASKPQWMEGIGFLSQLRPGAKPLRTAIFAERNWHNNFDPIRCIRTKRHKLVCNGRPDQPYRPTSDVESSPSWLSWRALYHSGKPALQPRHQGLFAPSRSFLELYDLETDPHEYVNRISDPSMSEVLAELEFGLSDWMHETYDFLPPLFYSHPARRNPSRRIGV